MKSLNAQSQPADDPVSQWRTAVTDRSRHSAGIALVSEVEKLRAELTHRKRQQVIMYSCLENIREGQNFEGCKRAADLALIAVRQIAADMLDMSRGEEESEDANT